MNTPNFLFSEENAIAVIELHKDEILRKVRCSTADANESAADGVSIDPGWPNCDFEANPEQTTCLNCTCCV